MGRKSKAEQEIDRAIGEWKQQLLEEAEGIISDDFTRLEARLGETVEELDELKKDAKKAAAEASLARGNLKEDHRDYRMNFTFYSALFCFLGSLLGSFITFLLLWYFW